MHRKKPSLQITEFDEHETSSRPPEEDSSAMYDPESVARGELTDEIEDLIDRRQRGRRRIDQMRDRAERIRRSIRDVEIIRPMPEEEDASAYASDSAVIHNRQQRRQEEYIDPDTLRQPQGSEQESRLGYFSDAPGEQPLTYDDTDASAPYFYDGLPPEADSFDEPESQAMPRRVSSKKKRTSPEVKPEASRNAWQKMLRILLILLGILLLIALSVIGTLYITKYYVLGQDQQLRADNETYIEINPSTTEDGHPSHIITVYGKENATILLRETQTSYVISDGKVDIEIPDYMWYDTESSTYAIPVETDTMDVRITPLIRYSQEGEQYNLDPITYTIDVPPSPVYLLNPKTPYAEVGVSIYELRLNVELGSKVIIDGSNVSSLIRDTGNVSKNVQVLPVGNNTISISVKSKYCRETKMEVTLYRAPQDIHLELIPTVIVEWNYEYISPEKYNSASEEERKTMNIPTITGTTLPGATITVEFPHRDLVQDFETGEFSFIPIFTELGNNDIVIRASLEGKNDSVITHTVYYMPNADIYTRRAWDLNAQYTDLVNYITMRKGTIYVGTGTITKIISSAPQMAVMNIGDSTFEKLVMLENSSKTTWQVGTKYRIYGDVYGMYDTMPRLTVRYTYLMEE